MTTTPQQKKEQEEILWHGVLGLGKGWEPPTCVSECDLVARPDQNEEIEAHEYVDTPATMKAKIAVCIFFLFSFFFSFLFFSFLSFLFFSLTPRYISDSPSLFLSFLQNSFANPTTQLPTQVLGFLLQLG